VRSAWGGLAFGGVADVLGGDAAADAGAGDGVDVDAEVAGEATDGGGGEGLAVLRGHAGEVAADRADDGAGVFAVGGLGGVLGGLGDGGTLGDGGGGLGRARRRAVAAGVGDEGLADLHDVAGRAVERGDGARARGGHLDEGLVRLHLGEDLVLLDGVALGNLPRDELGLLEALAEVGEDEDVRVGGDFAGHRNPLVVNSRRTASDAGVRTGHARPLLCRFQ
jgi:hypothetical protein